MYLVGAFILGTLLQVIVVVIPQVADVFKFVPLNTKQWVFISIISIMPIVIMEIQKKFDELKFGKRVYIGETLRKKASLKS